MFQFADVARPAVGEELVALERLAGLDSRIESPEMIFSFLWLGVIPALQLTNRGLVDAVSFELVSPFT